MTAPDRIAVNQTDVGLDLDLVIDDQARVNTKRVLIPVVSARGIVGSTGDNPRFHKRPVGFVVPGKHAAAAGCAVALIEVVAVGHILARYLQLHGRGGCG